MFVRVAHLKRVRAKGRDYYYHRQTNEALGTDREKAIARCLVINGTLDQLPVPSDSFRALCSQYKASPSFKRLRPKTQADYTVYIDMLDKEYGLQQVRTIDAEFVLELQETYAETPRKADYIIAVLRLLLTYAIRRPRTYGLQFNPALNMGRLHRTDGFQPWPESLIKAFRQSAYPELRNVMELALATGQRGPDVLAMSWKRYDGNALEVRQQKTGKLMWIPVLPDTRKLLAGLKRRAAVILTRPDGQPWKIDHLRHEVARIVKLLGHEAYSVHGWRKNACVFLAEAGCSDAEIEAITGQTRQMVEHYTKAARQKVLALSAMAKLRKAQRNKARTDKGKPSGKPRPGSDQNGS